MASENMVEELTHGGSSRLGCGAESCPEIDERALKGKTVPELGKSLPVPEQAALVRGALIHNIQEGEDKGIQSIKALGSTRELCMFTPEVQMGVVILGDLPKLPGMSLEESKQALLNGQEE